MASRRTLMFGVLAVITVLSALAVVSSAGAAVQSEEPSSPEWADEVSEDLEEAVAKYNSGGADPGVLGGWLLPNARTNLYVTDDEGAQAVYSLRFDDEGQVTALERGRIEDPTLRVRTTKRTIDSIEAASDVEAEVRQGIQSGRIRVKRVFEPFPGLRIWVGAEDVLIAAGGVMAASIVVAKFGFNSILSLLWRPISGLHRLLGDLWAFLTDFERVASLLTVLQMLGLLEPLQRLVKRVREAIHRTFEPVLNHRERSADQNESDEGGQ